MRARDPSEHAVCMFAVQVIKYLVIQIWCYELWKIPFHRCLSVSHLEWTKAQTPIKLWWRENDEVENNDGKALHWTLATQLKTVCSCKLAATRSADVVSSIVDLNMLMLVFWGFCCCCCCCCCRCHRSYCLFVCSLAASTILNDLQWMHELQVFPFLWFNSRIAVAIPFWLLQY